MNRLILETPSTTRQTDVRTRNAAVLVFALEFIFSRCANGTHASGLHGLTWRAMHFTTRDVLYNEHARSPSSLLDTPISVDFRPVVGVARVGVGSALTRALPMSVQGRYSGGSGSST